MQTITQNQSTRHEAGLKRTDNTHSELKEVDNKRKFGANWKKSRAEMVLEGGREAGIRSGFRVKKNSKSGLAENFDFFGCRGLFKV